MGTAGGSIAGCMYRVLQATAPDGTNLLKLLPISRPSGGSALLGPAPAMPNSPRGSVPSPVQLTLNTQLGNSAVSAPVRILQSAQPGNVILIRTWDRQEGARAGPGKEGLAAGASVREGLAPGASVREGLAPGAPMKEGLTPGANVREGLAPGAPMKEGLAPGASVREGLTPGAPMKEGLAPGANVREGLAPGASVREGLTPGASVSEGLAPGANVREALAPGASVREGLAPGASVKAAVAPGAHMKEGLAPGASVREGLVSGASVREDLAPGASVRAAPTPGAPVPVDTALVPGMAVPSPSARPSTTYIVVNTQALPMGTAVVPALPWGHHLQIPADAEVRAVPASLLPAAIQRKILAGPLAAPDGSAAVPTVIYVCPVNTVRSPQPPPRHLPPFCGQAGPDVPRTLLVTAPRGGSTGTGTGLAQPCPPMKWVVQDSALSPPFIPVKSSNDVASRILKTMLDSKNVGGGCANLPPLCASQAKIAPLKGNALIMYNGKVYLLTKRGSDVLSGQAGTPAAPPGDALSPKEPPRPRDFTTVSHITSTVVSLVLAKSKGVLGAQRDPEPRAGSQDSPPAGLGGHPKDSPAALGAPSAAQQDPCATPCTDSVVSSSTDCPAPAVGAPQGGQDRAHPPQAAEASQGHQECSSSEDWPKIQGEHKVSLGKWKTEPQEQPQWEQDLELRKKFGLFKEERICLRRIPVTENSWENPEGRSWASDSLEMKSGSCSSSSLDVGMRSHPQEGVKEEKIVVGLEEDFTRKRRAKSSPLSDSEKRRRTSPRPSPAPGWDPTEALPGDIPPAPASPESDMATGPCEAPRGGHCEPGTPPEGRESPGLECPVLVSPTGPPCLPEGSFRDDAFPAAPPELDETIREEKIWRLKQLLRQREAALEEMRKEMQQS
ncbi:ligand-dependent nuclear receptor-interacting factor 1 isoform X2 [Pithys albifrons albifrons]|uniref:ligand-dependent nuclear receptor-interacting factor 1 isoform X2 n=1 Tax=Pithys albifrons albifrons TaxID=3385563 RepID=UPI003A5CBA32